MTKWEYTETTIHIGTFAAFGLDGWELVSIYNGVAYFKRPIDGRRK